jgi:ABC-type dipeptide/oligopeptide/nickel transport system permease subunit
MAVTAEAHSAPGRARGGALERAWRRFRRKKLALVAVAFIVLEILVAVFAPALAPYDPYRGDYAATWQLPSRSHVMGTDELGRDVFSRVIYGSRVSLTVGILSQIIIVLIGVPVGACAGLVGGWFDYAVMRVVDVLSSLPPLLFYILLLVVLGAGFQNIIIAMAVTGWIGIARIVRGQVLSLKETDFIRATRAMGGGTRHIVTVHLIRNTMTPVIVTMTLGVPAAMFAEAGLSFLGLGMTPPTASWGQMIGAYQQYIQVYWHLTVFPAVVLAITMLAWVVVGDALRDALDPSVRR